MQRGKCIKFNPILHQTNAISGTTLQRQLDNEQCGEFTLLRSAEVAHNFCCHLPRESKEESLNKTESSCIKALNANKSMVCTGFMI